MLLSARPGAPVDWTIGRAGQPADTYPAVIADGPSLETMNGRLMKVATVIALRTTLAGETYTSERLVNVRFLTPRTTRVPELDDMPLAQLVAEHNARVQAYAASQRAEVSVDALAAALE